MSASLVISALLGALFSGSSGGGGTCGVNMSCAAESFTASATSGSAFTCSAELAICLDLGPGADNQIGTDGSGKILLGPAASSSVQVQVGASLQLQGNGNILANGSYDQYNAGFFLNSIGGAVKVTDVDGFAINGTSAVKGLLVRPVTVNIPSIGPNGCSDVAATVAGVEENDLVLMTTNASLGVSDVLVDNARVTNAGTDEVTFRACDVAGSAEDPASAAFLFLVVRT